MNKTNTDRTGHRLDTAEAKADIEKKCALYPGYKASVEHVRGMLRYLGGRNAASAFDMDFNHTPPKDGDD
jgi:hypothetical protein